MWSTFQGSRTSSPTSSAESMSQGALEIFPPSYGVSPPPSYQIARGRGTSALPHSRWAERARSISRGWLLYFAQASARLACKIKQVLHTATSNMSCDCCFMLSFFVRRRARAVGIMIHLHLGTSLIAAGCPEVALHCRLGPHRVLAGPPNCPDSSMA